MADAAKYTLEQREAGARALETALKAKGFKNLEVLIEEGNTPEYDSARVRLSDEAGVPTADFNINGKGFINLGAIYTDGDQRITQKAIKAVNDILDGSAEVKQTQYTKTKAAPGGTAFLSTLKK